MTTPVLPSAASLLSLQNMAQLRDLAGRESEVVANLVNNKTAQLPLPHKSRAWNLAFQRSGQRPGPLTATTETAAHRAGSLHRMLGVFMSRSGYSDECENIELYRANVDRALKGKRGQAFLVELASAMDAMPVKELIADELVTDDGACCTLGAICKTRQIDVSRIDYSDPWTVAHALGIARVMAAEIAYMNDEYMPRRHFAEDEAPETPAQRWTRMRKWVSDNLAAKTPNRVFMRGFGDAKTF